MGTVESDRFPRGANCGLRKLTTNHLAATRLAAPAPGLPAGLRHPNQLLAALRRAAPYLGHTRLLPLMEALFRWTQPQDWADGTDPVVWPSNDELALVLDCSERHVSRLIAAAIEARLIAPRDGADRKRRGSRQEGRIVWAWGLNLRPMAARHADFVAAAEAGERERRRCRDLRRQGAAARQFITRLPEVAREHGLALPCLEDYAAEARAGAARLRRTEEAGALAAATADLQSLAARAREALEQAVQDANMSGSVDQHVRPILPTNSDSDSEKASVTAQEEAARVAPLPCPDDGAGPAISPAELAHLVPKLRHCLATSRPGWDDIHAGAARLAQHLGIPPRLYGETCGALGRHRAAMAIAIISTKPDDHFHTAAPGGYLRGMLRRAAEGRLYLDRSIHGLRERAGQGMRQLTAVNSGRASTTRSEMRYSRSHALGAAYANGTHE